MSKLFVPIGIPGCGKSTVAHIFGDLHWSIVSTDAIRRERYGTLTEAWAGPEAKARNQLVFDAYHRRLREGLVHGQDVYADATNLTVRARAELALIARETGATRHALMFPGIALARVRNAKRPSDQVVPTEVMERMEAQFHEAVSSLPGEGFDSIFVLGIGAVNG